MEKPQFSSYGQYRIEGVNDILHIVEKFLLPKTYDFKQVCNLYSKYNFQNIKLLGIDTTNSKNFNKKNSNDDKISNMIRQDHANVMNGLAKGQGTDIQLFHRLKSTCINTIISSQILLFQTFYKDYDSHFTFIPNDKKFLISSTSASSGQPNTNLSKPNTPNGYDNGRPKSSGGNRFTSGNSNNNDEEDFDNTTVRKKSNVIVNAAYTSGNKNATFNSKTRRFEESDGAYNPFEQHNALSRYGGILENKHDVEMEASSNEDKLLEYQLRICSLCRLCYGEMSSQSLQSHLDVAISYAKRGMWDSMLEKLVGIEDQIKFFASNSDQNNKYRSERQQYYIIALVLNSLFNELREYAVAYNGQIDTDFITLWITNANDILISKESEIGVSALFIESMKGLCLRVAEQLLIYIQNFNFYDDQIIGTINENNNSVTGTGNSDIVQKPFWGRIVDFLRYSCEIVQSWIFLIESSYFIPQHLVALQLPCILNDRLNRQLCDINQLLMYYRYLPEPTQFISKLPSFYENLKKSKVSGKYSVKVPIIYGRDSKSLVQLSQTTFKGNSARVEDNNGNTTENVMISYDLPLTFEEILIRAAIAQGEAAAAAVETTSTLTNHAFDMPIRHQSVSPRMTPGKSPRKSDPLANLSYFEYYRLEILNLYALHQLSIGHTQEAENLLHSLQPRIERQINFEISELYSTNFYRLYSTSLIMQCYSQSNHILTTSKNKANEWFNSRAGKLEFDEYRSFIIQQKTAAAKANYTLQYGNNSRNNSNKMPVIKVELSKKQELTIKKQLIQNKMNELSRAITHAFGSNAVTRNIPDILDSAYRYKVKVYESYEKHYGNSHVMTSSSCVSVASALVYMNKLVEARQWLTKSIKILERNKTDEMTMLSNVQQKINKSNNSQRAIAAVQLKLVTVMMQDEGSAGAGAGTENNNKTTDSNNATNNSNNHIESSIEILREVAAFYYTQAYSILTDDPNENTASASILVQAKQLQDDQRKYEEEYKQFLEQQRLSSMRGLKPVKQDVEQTDEEIFANAMLTANTNVFGKLVEFESICNNVDVPITNGEIGIQSNVSTSLGINTTQAYMKKRLLQLRTDVEMAVDLNTHLAYLLFFYQQYKAAYGMSSDDSSTAAAAAVAAMELDDPANASIHSLQSARLSSGAAKAEEACYDAIGLLISLSQLTELSYGWTSIENATVLLQIGDFYALMGDKTKAHEYYARSLDAFEMDYESNTVISHLKKLLQYSEPQKPGESCKQDILSDKLLIKIFKYNEKYEMSRFHQVNKKWIEKQQLLWDQDEVSFFYTSPLGGRGTTSSATTGYSSSGGSGTEDITRKSTKNLKSTKSAVSEPLTGRSHGSPASTLGQSQKTSDKFTGHSPASLFNATMHMNVLMHLRQDIRQYSQGSPDDIQDEEIENNIGNINNHDDDIDDVIDAHMKGLDTYFPEKSNDKPQSSATAATAATLIIENTQSKVKVGDKVSLYINKIECKELAHKEFFGGKNDVFVVFEWCGEKFETAVIDDAGDSAVFHQPNMILNIDHIHNFNIKVSVFDKNAKSNVLIGEMELTMSNVTGKDFVYKVDIFDKKLTKTGSLTLNVQLKIALTSTASSGTTIAGSTNNTTKGESAIKMKTIVAIKRIECINLKNVALLGRNNVLVEFESTVGEKYQTQVLEIAGTSAIFENKLQTTIMTLPITDTTITDISYTVRVFDCSAVGVKIMIGEAELTFPNTLNYRSNSSNYNNSSSNNSEEKTYRLFVFDKNVKAGTVVINLQLESVPADYSATSVNNLIESAATTEALHTSINNDNTNNDNNNNKVSVGDVGSLLIHRIVCDNLKHVEIVGGKNDIYLVIEWCDKKFQTVVKDDAGDHAVFEEKNMIITPETISEFKLHIRVYGKISGAIIGEAWFMLNEKANHKELYCIDIYDHKSAISGQITLNLEIFIPITNLLQINKIQLNELKFSDNNNIDGNNSKKDIYVIIEWCGMKYQSKLKKDVADYVEIIDKNIIINPDKITNYLLKVSVYDKSPSRVDMLICKAEVLMNEVLDIEMVYNVDMIDSKVKKAGTMKLFLTLKSSSKLRKMLSSKSFAMNNNTSSSSKMNNNTSSSSKINANSYNEENKIKQSNRNDDNNNNNNINNNNNNNNSNNNSNSNNNDEIEELYENDEFDAYNGSRPSTSNSTTAPPLLVMKKTPSFRNVHINEPTTPTSTAGTGTGTGNIIGGMHTPIHGLHAHTAATTSFSTSKKKLIEEVKEEDEDEDGSPVYRGSKEYSEYKKFMDFSNDD